MLSISLKKKEKENCGSLNYLPHGVFDSRNKMSQCIKQSLIMGDYILVVREEINKYTNRK